jgi:hypothetical protein
VTTYARVASAVAAVRLTVRGGFAPLPSDGVPARSDGRPAQTLVLVGMTSETHWQAFRASAEFHDGAADPLDRWSHRVLTAIARESDGWLLEPSGGPPWWPFQRWAQRAQAVYPSPLGLLIHPSYGLWHAYRGALAFAEPFETPRREAQPSPCANCPDRPCLAGCPVGAFGAEGLAVADCAGFLRSDRGEACLASGCLARRACPIGRAAAHAPDQARFHLQAFLQNRA